MFVIRIKSFVTNDGRISNFGFDLIFFCFILCSKIQVSESVLMLKYTKVCKFHTIQTSSLSPRINEIPFLFPPFQEGSISFKSMGSCWFCLNKQQNYIKMVRNRDGGLEDRPQSWGRPRDLILMASVSVLVSAAHVSVLVSEVPALSTGSREPRPASRPNLDGLGLGHPCLGLGLGLRGPGLDHNPGVVSSLLLAEGFLVSRVSLSGVWLQQF